MIKYPKTVEELYKTHDGFIKDWIKFNNSALLDSNEFISDIYYKVTSENTLSKFDPEQGFKFETWFNTVLRNFYFTKVNKTLKENWESLDSNFVNEDSSELRKDLKDEQEIDQLDSIIRKDSIDFLIDLIDKIDNDRDRVLIKLKIYQKGQDQLVTFKKKDIDYINLVSNLKRSEIQKFIDLNVKDTYGLKDKVICDLLGISAGSMNTFYQRSVRKWLNA
jgi:hypothetical protein